MEDFVGRDKIAEQLKIPAATVDYLRRKRGLPCVKVGKHCRYIASEVVRWLKKGAKYDEKSV